jgi:hypothetical protein
MENRIPRELFRLAYGKIERQSTPTATRRLEHLLRESKEARVAFIELMELTATLHWQRSAALSETPIATVSVTDEIDEIAGVPARLHQEPVVKSAVGRASARSAKHLVLAWRDWIPTRVAAAVLYGGLFLYFASLAILVSLRSWDRREPALSVLQEYAASRPAATQAANGTARLVRGVECLWKIVGPETQRTPIQLLDGATLPSQRRMRLESGIAELVFSNGARVSLEAPCEFEVQSVDGAYLQLGKLLAVVPKESIGFKVTTPTLDVVDLGTEFGIEVDARRTSTVHVIQGLVKVTSRNEQSAVGESRQLTTHQSMRVGVDQNLEPIAFDPGPFAKIRELAMPVAPCSPDKISGLRLWLRADVGVVLDEAGQVERWADQSGNHFDAVQPKLACRPRWERGLAAPRISFDGKDDFLQCSTGLEIDNSGDSTLYLVIQQFGRFKANSGIFSLRSREFADWNSADGFSLSRGPSAPDLLGVMQGCNYLGSKVTQNDVTLAGGIDENGESLIVVTKSKGTAALRINGKTTAFDSFDFYRDDRRANLNTAGYLIGARHDNGSQRPGVSVHGELRIVEIICFDRAITGNANASLEAYLATRSTSVDLSNITGKAKAVVENYLSNPNAGGNSKSMARGKSDQ